MMWTTLLLAIAAAAAPPTDNAAIVDTPPVTPATYHTYDQLTDRIHAMVEDHGATVSLSSIATSDLERLVHLIQVAAPSSTPPEDRPAMLIVAGLDGTRILGSEVAMGVIEELLACADRGEETVTSLLKTHTFYVAPRVNPDGVEQFFAATRTEHIGTMTPDDQDRDGRLDEDGPDDLDGNGVITLMRVPKADEADHFPDPADDQLHVKARWVEGERATFAIYTEGLDDDGDGQYNEDPPGGIDLNMNFMHGYPEHTDGAGAFPLCAQEARGLVDFAISHPRITTIVIYDRHDTLTTPPAEGGTHKAGTPKVILKEDADLYRVMSERYTTTTGLESVPSGGSWDGSFLGWAYAQYGVPVFATSLWTVPGEDRQNATTPQATDDGLTPSPVGDISMETLEELRSAAEAQGQEVDDEMIAQLTPEMVERFAVMAGVEVRRVTTPEQEAAPSEDDPGKPRDESEARRLTYSDDVLDGDGFIPWTPYDHPTLGEVEIGGFAPYLTTTPPPREIPALARNQAAFVVELAGLAPRVSLQDLSIERLGTSLWEIKAAVVNEGVLPTSTAMGARSRGARPVVVRLGTALEKVAAGQRVAKVWKIPGSGGRHDLRWLVTGDAGDTIDVTLYSERLGEEVTSLVLADDKGGDQ